MLVLHVSAVRIEAWTTTVLSVLRVLAIHTALASLSSAMGVAGVAGVSAIGDSVVIAPFPTTTPECAHAGWFVLYARRASTKARARSRRLSATCGSVVVTAVV